MRRKIVFISSCPSKWWPGCEVLWSQAAIRLLREKELVVFASLAWREIRPRSVREIKRLGGRVVFTKTRKRNLFLRALKKIMKNERGVAWLKKINPDFVVISEGDCFEAMNWMEACRLTGIRYATVTHSCSPWVWPSGKEFRKLRDNYCGAERCFFVSRENLELLEMKIARELQNAGIIRNPYNVDYNTCLPWPRDSKKIKIACIASAEFGSKGQDILFRVFGQEKWRKRPVEISLFLYGGHDHDHTRELKEVFEAENFHLFDYVEKIEDIWREHHALILPSRREGLPLVVVEAMLCGRVCVVTDVGGNREIIEDNINGFIASAPNMASLDEAAERFWQRKDELEIIGKTAAEKIRKLVPDDPVGIFVEEIKSLIKK